MQAIIRLQIGGPYLVCWSLLAALQIAGDVGSFLFLSVRKTGRCFMSGSGPIIYSLFSDCACAYLAHTPSFSPVLLSLHRAALVLILVASLLIAAVESMCGFLCCEDAASSIDQ